MLIEYPHFAMVLYSIWLPYKDFCNSNDVLQNEWIITFYTYIKLKCDNWSNMHAFKQTCQFWFSFKPLSLDLFYCFLPAYPIKQNRTKNQSNPIEHQSFNWVRKSNKIKHLFCCEFDFWTNRTQSNSIRFDFVRNPSLDIVNHAGLIRGLCTVQNVCNI